MKTILFTALILSSALNAESLFNSDSVGVKYKTVFSKAPHYETSSNSIGFAVNLGLMSLVGDIAHHKDVSKVHNSKATIASFGEKVETTISVNSFSKNLREIWLNANFKNPKFKLANGKDNFNVLVKARIDTCNGEKLPNVIDRKSDLESIIKRFDDFDFAKILFCKLSITKMATNVKHQSLFRTHGNYGFEDHFETNTGATILINGDNPTISVSFRTRNPSPRVFEGQMTGPTSTSVSYELVTGTSDSDKATKAVQAGKEMTRALLNYSDQMLATYDFDEAKKTAATQAFFNSSRSEKFRTWVKTIKEGIPHMDIKDVLTLNFSVNQAYAYAKYFEGKVFDQFHIDRIISTEDNDK